MPGLYLREMKTEKKKKDLLCPTHLWSSTFCDNNMGFLKDEHFNTLKQNA